jgi:uncharacterized protein (TIGR00730 family)
MNLKTITIFGSSLPQSGEPDYEEAYLLGKMLARKGFNICSGGAQGIMDAVSKGAVEEGKEAIGITVSMFNSPSSKYLTKEVKCDTLFNRIDNLVEYGDGFIILPGGTGTLLELAIIWEMFNKEVIAEKPSACLGDLWNRIVAPMEERVKYEKRKTNLIKCFNDINSIIDFMTKSLKN